jgi:hypothetical protein
MFDYALYLVLSDKAVLRRNIGGAGYFPSVEARAKTLPGVGEAMHRKVVEL